MRITHFRIMIEIKRTYQKYRQSGHNRDSTIAKLLEEYHNEVLIGKDDDAYLFWVALADAQCTYNELSEDIAARALDALDALTKSDLEITPGDISRRQIRYQKAPMPERKTIRKPQKYHCKWKLGDTFAYQLFGENADNAGIAGRYVLLRKVGEKLFEDDGPIIPVITLTMWDDKKLPENAQEFQRLPLLKLENGRLGSPKTHFEYRALLMIFSTRTLNQLQLIYLGNFADVPLPRDEVIFEYPGYMLMVPPTALDRCCSNYWIKQKKFASVVQSQSAFLEPWCYPYSPFDA